MNYWIGLGIITLIYGISLWLIIRTYKVFTEFDKCIDEVCKNIRGERK